MQNFTKHTTTRGSICPSAFPLESWPRLRVRAQLWSGAVPPFGSRGGASVPLFLLEPAPASPPHRSGALLQVGGTWSRLRTRTSLSVPMCCVVPDRGKLLFANACGLGTGLFKLGGCETSFIFCDQFCLSVGNNLVLQCRGCLWMAPKRDLMLGGLAGILINLRWRSAATPCLTPK